MMLKRIIETYPRRFHFRSLVCLLNNLFIMVNVAQQLPDSNLCFMVTQFLGAYFRQSMISLIYSAYTLTLPAFISTSSVILELDV